jgi:hypothetical protein
MSVMRGRNNRARQKTPLQRQALEFLAVYQALVTARLVVQPPQEGKSMEQARGTGTKPIEMWPAGVPQFFWNNSLDRGLEDIP